MNQVLIKWIGLDNDEATWLDVADVQVQFHISALSVEDKAVSVDGAVDRVSTHVRLLFVGSEYRKLLVIRVCCNYGVSENIIVVVFELLLAWAALKREIKFGSFLLFTLSIKSLI